MVTSFPPSFFDRALESAPRTINAEAEAEVAPMGGKFDPLCIITAA